MQIDLVFSLEEILLICVINGLFWGIICHFVAKSKNNSGFWWGFFLGLIGLIVVACATPKEQELEQQAMLKFDNSGATDPENDNDDEGVISETAPMLKRCPQCGAEMQITLVECPKCAFNFEAKRKSNEEKPKDSLGSRLLKGILVGLLAGAFVFMFSVIVLPMLFESDKSEITNSTPNNNTYNNQLNTKVARKNINDVVNRTLFEDELIKITVTNIDNLDSFSIKVDNKTDKELTFRLNSVAVNRCGVRDWYLGDQITAHNSAIVTYSFNDVDLYGITELKAIDFSFTCDDGNYQGSKSEGICHIATKGFENADFPFTFRYPKVYENDDLEVYLVKNGNTYNDIGLIYYNKSDRQLFSVGAEHFAFNGIMVDLQFNSFSPYNILPHSIIYTQVTDGTIPLSDYISPELEEKGIKTIEKMQCKFSYYYNYLEDPIKSGTVVVFDE